MTKIELCTGRGSGTGKYDTTCEGSVTVGSGNYTVDIASVSAGADVGAFVSTSGLPIGSTFKYVKPTFKKTFIIKGAVYINDNITCVTDENATIGSNTKYETIMAGKKCSSTGSESSVISSCQGEATKQTYNMFTSGSVEVCRTASTNTCASSQTQTWNYSLPDDSSNYGTSFEKTGSSSEVTSMIYELGSPYTVGVNAPKITIAFGVKTGLEAGNDPDGDNNGCYIGPYYPKVNISVAD